MRRKSINSSSDYKIMVVDDEIGIIESLTLILSRRGFKVTGVTSPLEAVERVRVEHFDMLILDYIMHPIHGDEVVEKIREFNDQIYILILTGHKDLAPPFETLKALDIQGYCEKSDKFDQLVLLVESGMKSVAQYRMIKKFERGLSSILESIPRIYQLKPVKDLLEDILKDIMHLANSGDAFILIDYTPDLKNDRKSIFKGMGKYDLSIDGFLSILSTNLMEQVGYARRLNQVVLMEKGVILPFVNECLESLGAIYVEGEQWEENLKLIEIYANQAAVSLSNSHLHTLVSEKNDELNKVHNKLKIRYMDLIGALRLAVDAKDIYTRGHSDRVAYYSVKIGEAFGLDRAELEMLKTGGIFHDIGKIGISDDILLKAGSLSQKELLEIRKHPIKGANMLSAISMFNDIIPLVRYHHERVDGKGYPDGLKGAELPFLTRIITVADAFDSITSDRHYRNKMSLKEAKVQLLNGAGTQFDMEVVEKFVGLLSGYNNMESELEITYL
ncbi:MAG: DUF3369 domain-containing protein [Clostridia bacterium]|nr:DUF3369 domain-containing protein [Clostridia bacterium]